MSYTWPGVFWAYLQQLKQFWNRIFMTSLNQRLWWGPRPLWMVISWQRWTKQRGGGGSEGVMSWRHKGNLNCFLNTSLGQSHTLRFDCQNQDTTWPDRLHYPEWPGDEVKEVRLVDSRKSKTAVWALFAQMPWLVAYGNFLFAGLPLVYKHWSERVQVKLWEPQTCHLLCSTASAEWWGCSICQILPRGCHAQRILHQCKTSSLWLGQETFLLGWFREKLWTNIKGCFV